MTLLECGHRLSRRPFFKILLKTQIKTKITAKVAEEFN
jgi:hypothetical protein